ncbi:MAG: hypothetical protein AAF514_21430 [Verrucomicrobiota bacterium]
MKELNVALVRADWSDMSPAIGKDLARFNRSNIPVNLVYPQDSMKPPIILPELLTQKSVLAALKKATRIQN